MKYKALPGVLFLLWFTIVSISAQTSETRPRIPVIKTGVLNKKAISPLPAPILPSSVDPRDVAGSGPVNVEALIDMDGKVISAKAISGHPLLRKSAEEAALKTRFRPTLADGPAIRVLGTLVYDLASFGLRPEEKPPVVTTARVISHLRPDLVLSLPKPRYPEAAKAINAKGPVNVEVRVDENGKVILVKVLSGHPLLRAAAVSAAKRAKFKPTGLDRVHVLVNIVYNFQ
ncbi:MAG TPA: TonB family protein [Pyrinomonadaceae bacterium]|jgi:TonB family protein|nr:TonB family protein [Pyrinomonadaceae bacterium]